MSCYAKHVGCLLAVCLVLSGLVPARAEYIIDNFSAPVAVVVPVIALLDADPTIVETPDPGILGGERDILLDVIGTPGLSSFIGEIGDGSFIYGGSSPGTAASIQYDGLDVDPPGELVNSGGLGGMDLTLYGDRFALDFLRIDGGDSQFTEIWITVYSGIYSDLLVELIPDSPGPSTYTSPPLAAWVTNADPTNVTAIEFGLNSIGIADVDFELDAIRVVPEPSTLVLCGLGLVCLLAYARRRRK